MRQLSGWYSGTLITWQRLCCYLCRIPAWSSETQWVPLWFIWPWIYSSHRKTALPLKKMGPPADLPQSTGELDKSVNLYLTFHCCKWLNRQIRGLWFELKTTFPCNVEIREAHVCRGKDKCLNIYLGFHIFPLCLGIPPPCLSLAK